MVRLDVLGEQVCHDSSVKTGQAKQKAQAGITMGAELSGLMHKH